MCCGSSKTAHDNQEPIKQRSIVAQISKVEPPSDALTIEKVELNGNILSVHVSYGGGCASHDFTCMGSKAISKSIPPQRSIRLIHSANGDQCKKFCKEELLIDIKALAFKQVAGNETILNLDGWKEPIRYIYQ